MKIGYVSLLVYRIKVLFLFMLMGFGLVGLVFGFGLILFGFSFLGLFSLLFLFWVLFLCRKMYNRYGLFFNLFYILIYL